ncbi:MAG: hypothetical protein HY811_05595 [Planctomycetes bacterium]|nr:hypothetical protein [Planctomycetota bacterium]
MRIKIKKSGVFARLAARQELRPNSLHLRNLHIQEELLVYLDVVNVARSARSKAIQLYTLVY